jgi:hypothetical protein
MVLAMDWSCDKFIFPNNPWRGFKKGIGGMGGGI